MTKRFYLVVACALALCLAFSLAHLGLAPVQAAYTAPDPPAASAPAFTIVAGSIATHTTWTKAGSPYSVTTYIHLQAGIMLTIEPGVEVQFPSTYVGLGVHGTLDSRLTDLTLSAPAPRQPTHVRPPRPSSKPRWTRCR